MMKIQNLIGGRHCDAAAGRTFEKLAPATGDYVAAVPASTAEDVDRAVRAAHAALHDDAWARAGGPARARWLLRLADLVERDGNALTELLAVEQGRPLAEMRMMDLPMCIDTLRYFAGWADKLEGRTIPTDGFMGCPTLSYTRRAPVGVAGQIIPWNAPLMIAVWKLAPALAAGCPVVVKPSEDTPLAIARLGELVCEVGLPTGVVNIVHGVGAEVGAALVAHPLVNKISFTGSTEVGRAIAGVAAKTFKRVTLELGGKAAQIVFADADLDRAIPSLMAGMFANQGQTCAAGSRVLAHRSIAQALEERLADAARAMRIGAPSEPGVQMGALINPRHLARVRALVDGALAEGAVMLAGDEQVPPRGCFMRPTILGGVHPGMRIARDEVFGPVGMVMPFETEDDAVRIANDTPFGLSASVWTQDVGTAHRVAERLDVGAVAINAWSPIDARLPWGGTKQSGIGRDLSKAALDSYLEEKIVTAAL
ncbi:aldehyde dehydrogenase [Burkholderia cenocepacia]|uniref:aldehyde dehydrogenase family protein n=1 Tax=Burkholderia cepacia complex TaxID=87882 RepID=UPI000F582214|nr:MULTISPECIES: aldehyde dehydrogenase family protein [Burkholderia cepacia complex]ELW9447556.1 aldehyde dehydrogenase [Burkholderia cenocepacia]MBR8484302.1 aldehyde dehydrogenase [Burkholderia cenocepacia]MDN7468444.1 aldehyde dehydrogenase family protein [Burkholderia orbicola]MDN7501481.1 aldehyde dehydrogenase family protein [Burkholderia orbicola]RQU19106.1 aldehyde dehydrogenase [Burkholderia cenocepacia]